VIGHLEGAVECDRTAQALYPQTIEALIELQDQSQRLNTSTPSEDMQRPSAELPYHYKVAVASLSIRLGSSMTKVRVGGDEWQSLIDFHEELNRSWTQNCEFVELCGTDGRVVKKNMFQHLLDLTKHPSTGTKLLNLHDGTGDMAFDEPQPTWNNWPTPMHWLISMPDSYLTSLTEALLRPATSSKVCTAHMVNYERSTQDVFMLPDLGIELFGTPLHWAVRCRNLPLATVLLDHGADINARWFRRLPLVNDRIDEKRPLSYSALDIAVMWHFPELVKLLLSRNAETYGGYHYEKHHCVNLIGAPVPMFARHVAHGIMVRSALISTIRVLEESGQSLDQKNSSGESTFSLALEVCDQEVYILETLRLRSWTADQRLLERLLHSVCKDAAVRRSRTERLRILLPLVDDPNAVDDRGLSALHHASLASGASHVQILLNDARVKPTMFTKDGHSALTLAAQAGAESTITAAWEAGVDVEQCDKNGRAPLQCALEARQTSLAVQMIQILRVSVSWSCNELEHPSSALFSATRSRERETSILKDLLDECPILQTLEVLNERTANNWTVLHQAAWYGDFQGVHALIEAGASRTIASTRGAGRRRKGTPYEVVALHLASLKSLGEDGWKLNSISWIEHGGRARWAAYLDELSKISDHLAR
jgi:ankyrin repeat protein